jgi:hypothetical protein
MIIINLENKNYNSKISLQTAGVFTGVLAFEDEKAEKIIDRKDTALQWRFKNITSLEDLIKIYNEFGYYEVSRESDKYGYYEVSRDDD